MGGSESASPRVIGRYVLHGEIAAGGMATVHFGRLVGPAGFSRSVAIKRLHAQFAKDPDFVAMFLDEARVAARIFHPNVVPTLDVVTHDDELFLVMEYVRGAPLAKLMRVERTQGKRTPARIVSTVMSGVLNGLHAAHDAKDERGERLDIVHRDVSPQNVLVGTDGVARVLDFGVAKAAGRLQTTRDGQLKGKLSYMAPEQITGGAVTRLTDVYAASVVLWEALTGQRLFKAENEGNVLVKVLSTKVAPPSSIAPELSEALDRVVLRGLDRNPANRFATAREMAHELEQCMPGASAAQVGEWVESLAADELSARAARIAEIERADGTDSNASMRQLAAQLTRKSDVVAPAQQLVSPAMVSVPTSGFETPPAIEISSSGLSQLASVSLTQSSPPPPIRGSRRVLYALLATFAIGALALVTFVVSRGPSVLPNSSSLAAPPPLETPVVASPPPAAIPDSPPATPTVTASATASAPASATTPPKPAASPPRAIPRGRADCNPPYTTDDKGHVHFKPACL